MVKTSKIAITKKDRIKKIELSNATLMTVGEEIINIFVEGTENVMSLYRKECKKVELFF